MVAMSLVEKPMNFRVMYKFPKMSPNTSSYVAGTLKDLMKMLSRAENVTEESVEFLYVHEIHQDGSVTELVAIENKATQLIQEVTSNVTSMMDRSKELMAKSKLLMRFVRNDSIERRVTDGWGWPAYPAPYWEKKSDG